MDNLENQTLTPVSPSQPADLQAQVASLRHLVVSLLVLILIVSGTLSIYLLRQYRTVRRELAPLQAQEQQISAEANRVVAVGNEFLQRLVEYGKTHPDFMAILNGKYGIRLATNATPVVPGPGLNVPAGPGATKAPATKAPPKK